MAIFNDESKRGHTTTEIVGISVAVILILPILLTILFVLFALLMICLGYK